MRLDRESTRELEQKILDVSKAEIIPLIMKYKLYELKGGVLGRVFEKLYVNPDGFSAPILISDLEKIHHSFHTTNGGDWCRSKVSYLGKKYIITRKHKNGSIYSVNCEGLQTDNCNNKEIKPDILKIIKKRKCAILDVATNIECDFKVNKKDERINVLFEEQSIDDFQALSKAAVDAKKSHCKTCIETGKRYNATRLGYSVPFICGDENSKTCIGCYWNDPIEFNKTISKTFKKED